MIEIRDFSIGFKSVTLLNDVNLTFKDGELTSIIGKNGSGKSTLMKAISGLNPNFKGEILIDGKNLRELNPSKLSSLISYVNTQRPRMTNLKCRDVVALGRTPYTAWHGKLSKEDEEKIKEALELVGMLNYSDRQLNSLSDGESQKIMIARAIAQDTKNIILDEPTSFLDLPTRYELVNLLKKLVESGKTIIFSTHELDIALKLSDSVALVDSETIFKLPASEMFQSPRLKNLFDPFSSQNSL